VETQVFSLILFQVVSSEIGRLRRVRPPHSRTKLPNRFSPTVRRQSSEGDEGRDREKKTCPRNAESGIVWKNGRRWTMALDQEIETYRRKLPKLLVDEGKHVLIHASEILGVFPTREEALLAGYERFDHGPFLVKRILAHEQPVYLRHEMVAPCPSSPSH